GHTNNADIYINNARPTIQYNTIRNSSHSGVYVTGDGSDAVPISCNNLKDNHYGIYAAGNAQPSVSGNNFLRNHTFGLYNAHAQTVTANDNWWNDPNGPNTNGDATFGVVTTDTWLTAVSTCIATPPTNSPPLTPRNPSPADGAVRVAILEEGQPVAVTLSWAGGDPNPWDTVVYDLYFGTSADTLALVAESLDSATYAVSGLTGGTTYYWQVVARDDAGAETSGPVWSFTTIGDPPDLQVSQLTWNPTTDLVAGQSITLVATITNAGSGPVVDAFKVAFAIDGTSVGTVTVNPVIAAAATRQVSITWTTTKGSHTLTVTADSADAVEESYEENNTLSASLPEVIDTTPPTLVVSTPSNGAILQEVSSLSMTLADAHGSIADAAVIASVTLVNGSGQAMTGSTVESGDVFTFTPAASPLPDDTYTFSLDGVDDSGNTAHFSIAFTVDGQVPAAPTLTGGEILSGTLSVQPAENRSNIATITVTGTREDATAIYINGSQKVALGSGDWSTTMSLSQDDNALEIWAHDAAGNVSESIFADVSVDSVAPTITGAFPTADSFLSAAPAVVSVSYTETGSGLNTEACTRSLQDADGNTIAGTWDFTADGTVSFTPAAALADGGYALSVQLEDNYTNSSSALNRAFTVDTVAPEAPVIDAVTTPTHNPSQTITGTKEAYAAISMNGTQVVANTEATTWQTTVTLASGENTFAFVATDRAGNASETASTVIVFDDIAPDPVTTLTVNGQGSGTTAILNWSGYDEAAHGDVASYRIYWQEGTSFTVVTTDMPVHDTIPAGTFTATATSLIKGTTVWFAVVAVDKMGNFNSAVTPVSALLEDIQAPENVTNLAVSAQADSLTFTWTASANSAGDLAGYRIYLDGGTEYTALAADQLTHTFSGLGTAEAHTLKITAVDDAAEPNESSGASLSGVTWLPNPSGLSGEPFSGYVQLAWNAAQPSAHVKSYRVYTSDAPSAISTTVPGPMPSSPPPAPRPRWPG
uniref:CARDB domain-containing protein n=1 Tax=Desulfosarcina cetonica TaxID=90730 RepID=UPI000ABC9BA2